MSKYCVVLSCPDCLGEDFLGCFDGGTETLDERFSTKEEAEKFGNDYVRDSIWLFSVEEVQGE